MLSNWSRRLASNHLNRKLRVSERSRKCWKRCIITESIEPPLSSLAPEKPCSLVLVEDKGLYHTSWSSYLREALPNEYGLHFCSQVITLSSLEASLLEMTSDLEALPSVVLLARGPAVSLVAQFYLEDLPLSGLIMVDPILDPSMRLLDKLNGMYSEASIEESNFLRRVHSGVDCRPLTLESGVIPMLVLSSLDVLHAMSQSTARRHSSPNSRFGEVQVRRVGPDDDPSGMINNWIEEVVL